MKFKGANGSFKLFCRSVPVIDSRPRELNDWTICELKKVLHVVVPKLVGRGWPNFCGRRLRPVFRSTRFVVVGHTGPFAISERLLAWVRLRISVASVIESCSWRERAWGDG
jgi:hypothetical protein